MDKQCECLTCAHDVNFRCTSPAMDGIDCSCSGECEKCYREWNFTCGNYESKPEVTP